MLYCMEQVKLDSQDNLEYEISLLIKERYKLENKAEVTESIINKELELLKLIA